MRKVKIVGIGVLCMAGVTIDDVFKTLDSESKSEIISGPIEYKSILPSIKRRRINRYSDMAVYCSNNAFVDAKVDFKNLDPFRLGTIFTTGYGPMVSNIEFAKTVNKGDPDLCSPTVFANTVSNACVGHVAMALKCKGVSTIIMGSNNIGYSQMLLNSNKADYILSGAVEEYCEELYDSFKFNDYSKDVLIKEGTVVFLLKGEDEDSEDTDSYCELKSFSECSIGKYPLINETDKESAQDNIIETLSELISSSNTKIDLVISANNGTYFDEVENNSLKKVFNGKVPIIGNVKEFIGETLGASININILVASLILKYGMIPNLFKVKNLEKIENILVTGYDVTGNYIGYILSK